MNIEKLLKQKETLHPDLVDCVSSHNKMPSLHHPMIIEVPYTPQLNAYINYRYKETLKECEKARAERNWAAYLMWHHRPYRLHAFNEIADQLSNKEYWERLGSLWTGSENIWQDKALWLVALGSTRPHREYITDAKERKAFRKLPDSLTIYRGYHSKSKNKDGLSWTLDKEKAEWFANRFFGIHGNGLVATKTVSKCDVIAYFVGRGEEEIVVL